MSTNTKIKTDIQKLNVGSEFIDLYSIDSTNLGGTIAYFTPMTEGGSNVVFGGITYVQLPCEITGMEVTGDGRMPRPKIKVANVFLTFVGMVNAYQDGIGSKVTRIRTFKKYLDSQVTADSSAQFPQDIFYIEQKTIQNKNFIEWELISPMDIGNKQLPKNQVLSYCQHRYRIYDSGFDYTLASCPYTGTNYFNNAGESTTIDKDRCGKTLNDCELRYPNDNDQLPFKGFPVVGQIAQKYR
jgi:lambda family phage minor tail protein L